MKKNFTIGLLAISAMLVLTLSSCLKDNLPDYPTWENSIIKNVYIEYRYKSDQTHYGESVVAYQKLSVDQTIDTTKSTISLDITVPAASASFTDSVRNQVDQTHLWPYFDVSTAAKVTATGTTPEPGFATDFTKPQTYVVTAANGETRKWTIKVTSFIK